MDSTKESKKDKFKRLAESRTQKIVTMIASLSNCSNSYIYDYTSADVEKIFNYIQRELDAAKSHFSSTSREKKKFTL